MSTEITGTNISIPSDEDAFFAPISPAAYSVKDESLNSSANLLEMLQRGSQGFPGGRKITKKSAVKDLGKLGNHVSLLNKVGLFSRAGFQFSELQSSKSQTIVCGFSYWSLQVSMLVGRNKFVKTSLNWCGHSQTK